MALERMCSHEWMMGFVKMEGTRTCAQVLDPVERRRVETEDKEMSEIQEKVSILISIWTSLWVWKILSNSSLNKTEGCFLCT